MVAFWGLIGQKFERRVPHKILQQPWTIMGPSLASGPRLPPGLFDPAGLSLWLLAAASAAAAKLSASVALAIAAAGPSSVLATYAS